MYDNFGNEYRAEKISIANFKGSHYITAPLIADIETLGTISFVNVNSQASAISKMVLLPSVAFKDILIQ